MSARPHRCARVVFAVAIGAVVMGGDASLALERLDFTVSGTDKALTKAVRGASGLLVLEDDAKDMADEVLAAARAEYGRLIRALYAQGHYSPVISIRLDGREAASIAPLDSPSRIASIEVSVDPGPKFVFAGTRIRPLAPGTVLPEEFAAGKTAGSDVVRAAVTAGVDGWRNIGHAKAKVAGQDVVADHRANTLSADVHIAAGPALRFGNVAIVGNGRTRENRVRKIAGIPQGAAYNPAEIARAEGRLRRTGAFKSVAITEDDQITAPDLLGTTVTVVEEKRRHLSFGAEISSLEGLDLTAAWMHRNLLGGAEKLRIEGEVKNIGASGSGIDYGLAISIDRPATLTRDTTLRFKTEIAHVDEDDYRANILDLGIGFTHVFSDSLTGRIDLAYELAKGTAYSDNRAFSEDFTYRSISLPIGLTWDRRNDKTDATGGFYIDAEVKPFVGFGQTGSGARFTSDMRIYRGFGENDRFVLAGRWQTGAILGASLFEAPRDDLFYSGGGGTVRGQPYQSLGVNVLRSATGFSIGGTHFMSASVEMRAKVTQNIGIVGFVDAGRVDVGGFFDPSGDWHAGAGLGLRYDTGFGPIRLDVAGPVGGTTGKGVQIYVGLGQAF